MRHETSVKVKTSTFARRPTSLGASHRLTIHYTLVIFPCAQTILTAVVKIMIYR